MFYPFQVLFLITDGHEEPATLEASVPPPLHARAAREYGINM